MHHVQKQHSMVCCPQLSWSHAPRDTEKWLHNFHTSRKGTFSYTPLYLGCFFFFNYSYPVVHGDVMSLISPLWINPSLPGQQPALNEFPGSIVKSHHASECCFSAASSLLMACPAPCFVPYCWGPSPHGTQPSSLPPACPHFCPHMFHMPPALSYLGDRRKPKQTLQAPAPCPPHYFRSIRDLWLQ